ncbi:hypothetical protein NFT50_004377 [Salmonella enterica]|nr:hypothetical protein [Salmonella enterica]EJH7441111.1 hypothetical protein [Salmonella enterica]EJH7880480.1 hypothetical protein [Salmonella enterica]EJI6713229.1 hypothetical protein [Salmonella enterica]
MKAIIYITLLGYVFLSVKAFSTVLPPIAQQVKKILEHEKLISSPECTDYIYIPDYESGIDAVDVVEKHGGSCHGDPQVQHRLFSIFVDQKTHKMESDIDMDDQVNGTRSAFPPKN